MTAAEQMTRLFLVNEGLSGGQSSDQRNRGVCPAEICQTLVKSQPL